MPRLEVLEARLTPDAALGMGDAQFFAQLFPNEDNPDRFTLRIDLNQHPRGNDGLPDSVFISRGGGFVEVVLVARERQVLYQDIGGQVAAVELLGSMDDEIVLVEAGIDLPVSFDGGANDRLVRIGEAIEVPVPTDDIIAYGEDAILADIPAPPPPRQEQHDLISGSADFAFLRAILVDPSSTPHTWVVESAARPPREEKYLPPLAAMLGARPADEPVRVRTPSGGGHHEHTPAGGGDETPFPQEEEETEQDS